ncbi:hypothetical protein, variant [Phytophthora nicotianae]|uniref:Uncharacterized protein n=1 Tax=Phytophthora nicotianae TaxID=4792 RepID=W2LF79_PHYNI|nr:hypothetical protein, variant [Phytophthora nicotianae]
MAKTRDCIYESSPTMRRLQRGVRRPQCGLTSAEYSVRNQPSVIFKVIVTNANWTRSPQCCTALPVRVLSAWIVSKGACPRVHHRQLDSGL